MIDLSTLRKAASNPGQAIRIGLALGKGLLVKARHFSHANVTIGPGFRAHAMPRIIGPGRVVTGHPDGLEDLIGPETEVVGITTMDPLGLAYVSATYNTLVGFGGPSVNAREFSRLLAKLRRLRASRRFKIVAGGEAAWQIIVAGRQSDLGIDHLVCGRAEAGLGTVMDAVLSGTAPPVIRMKPSDFPGAPVPLIRAPAIYGDVEITRGCGRGCAFMSSNACLRRATTSGCCAATSCCSAATGC